jgi:hypothetical protein
VAIWKKTWMPKSLSVDFRDLLEGRLVWHQNVKADKSNEETKGRTPGIVKRKIELFFMHARSRSRRATVCDTRRSAESLEVGHVDGRHLGIPDGKAREMSMCARAVSGALYRSDYELDGSKGGTARASWGRGVAMGGNRQEHAGPNGRLSRFFS